MAITSKAILFCWQEAGLVNVEVELDVELESDNNLNLIANYGIYDIRDKIDEDSDEEVDDSRLKNKYL